MSPLLLRASHSLWPRLTLCDYLLYFVCSICEHLAQPKGEASHIAHAPDIGRPHPKELFRVPFPILVPLLAGSLLGLGSSGASAPPSTRSLCAPPLGVGESPSGCTGAPVVPVAGFSSPNSRSSSVWKFSRTQGAKEGESFAAITKTADTTQSDPDFAGLIVRCAPKGKVDVLVALIRPFPPRSHPQVTIAASTGGTLTVEASMAAAGAAVLLPDEVSAFASGKWQTTPSLSVAVKESDSEIKGVVSLTGLREAYNLLIANCGQ